MKSFAAFVVLEIAAIAVALPTAQWVDPCPLGCRLHISSNKTQFDGLYLLFDAFGNALFSPERKDRDGALFNTREPEQAHGFAEFFTELAWPRMTTLTLHGSDWGQHTLGFQEKVPGFLALVDMWLPWEQKPSASAVTGNKTEWGVFTIDPLTRDFFVRDESDIPTRKWIATPLDEPPPMVNETWIWYGLWDGYTALPYNHAELTIKAEALDPVVQD